MTERRQNRYSQIIERIFHERYQAGMQNLEFEREEFVRVAQELQIPLPRNLGDIIYSFRYRSSLPDSIQATAPPAHEWVIRAAGRGRYRFVVTTLTRITPTAGLVLTKIPDATPGIILMNAIDDEQGLLARLRYNRLIDVFTGITCYSLQNHLRTTVPNLGQVETDEIYVGVDRRGAHYVLPVQAKSGGGQLSVVQIEQDFALCAAKFSNLICRPIGAQFTSGEVIALFEFEDTDQGVAIASERHYRLVPPDQLTSADLRAYRERLP